MKPTHTTCVASLTGGSPPERAKLLQHLLREMPGATIHQITFEIIRYSTGVVDYIVTVIYDN